MINQANKSGEQPERFRPELYREIGKLGWRVPDSEQEVRAAEEWVAANPTRLPDGLRGPTEMNRPTKPGELLGRYLREDMRHRSPEEPKSRDEGRTDRDLER